MTLKNTKNGTKIYIYSSRICAVIFHHYESQLRTFFRVACLLTPPLPPGIVLIVLVMTRYSRMASSLSAAGPN